MLSELELRVLSFIKDKGVTSSTEISASLGLPKSSVFSVVYHLASEGYVRIVSTKKERKLALTEEGETRLKEGFPEENLLKILSRGPVKVQEAKDVLGKDFEIAMSWAKKRGLINIQRGEITSLVQTYTAPERELLEKAKRGERLGVDEVSLLKGRNLVEEKEETEIEVEFLKEPELRSALLFLTPELIRSGEWRKYEFKKFNVRALPPYVPIGKKHYFREFIERAKEVMISLGFSEVKSDYVEMEFYNFDMLFQPQDHPAREIHDSFRVEGKGEIKDEELLRKVKEVHEKWWNYKWDQEVALRLVMRSQTTATTARVLSTSPKPPARVFTIGKVFRPDAIDATHLIEFHQLDGLIVEEDFNLRKLLGVLKEIFTGLGIKEIKFKPAYFPFTEPSVEVYGWIDRLGWVEMAGAGLLRPEVTEPAGVYSPAGAWGLGLDRLAMLFLGVKDIRDLYSDDIEFLRSKKVEAQW
ncbi:MAG: phenylalanine--tRNA ligase subunit alpha [Candidatus Aramenus sulfurataquae]|jgi:phenylalanyl-tRNA synthetase alpha chain|uniref:Phenylalanine--tRNA ligase alpha subunit n=2 Tax=Candidatus Aramenus sulfurataquae TaxID=1326980 RepID=A0A0F2LP44_9CREN|nr:phenylalanine--tRNA ligase subunit alpha [Candidatus Aramenus sulfurataquae]